MIKNFFITLLLGSSLFATTPHWDNEQVVADYVHNSELQRRSTWHLLSQIEFKGDEKILDIGCGDGRNSAWMAWLVRQGSVIGIDPSEAMISWAQRQYHPSEFPNLTFAKGDAHDLPAGMFDIITSFFSLHLVKDKQKAIQGWFDQLSEGGAVCAVIPPSIKNNPEFVEAIFETMQSPRWAPYFKNFQFIFRFEILESYIKYFENAGFSVVHAENIESMDPFVNLEEAINWIKGTWPHVHYIPKELSTEFISEILGRYIQKRPESYSKEGVLCLCFGHYEIVAEKGSPE